ncbi:hypothetical protein Tco_0520979 [Tanacetum coccineum]
MQVGFFGVQPLEIDDTVSQFCFDSNENPTGRIANFVSDRTVVKIWNHPGILQLMKDKDFSKRENVVELEYSSSDDNLDYTMANGASLQRCHLGQVEENIFRFFARLIEEFGFALHRVRSRLVSDSTTRDVEWEPIEEERLEEPKEGWKLGESKKRSVRISSRMLIVGLVSRSRVTLVKAMSKPKRGGKFTWIFPRRGRR